MKINAIYCPEVFSTYGNECTMAKERVCLLKGGRKTLNKKNV